MTKYIDADIFVTHCCNSCVKNGVSCCPTVDSCDYIEDLQAFLVDAPDADVEPIVRGELRINEQGFLECSACGKTLRMPLTSTYEIKRCYICGAHMERSGSGE